MAEDDPDDVTVPYDYRSNTVSESDEEKDNDRAGLRDADSRDPYDTGQSPQLRTRSGRAVRKPIRFV